MKKQNKRLIELHSLGSNCNTNATKTILQYYGYSLDEDVVFGLGSGLGFIYQYYSNIDSYFLSGKNESLELNIATLFGGTVISHSFDDPDRAWQEAKACVDLDIPIMLDLSITHLPYFTPYLEGIKNIGFGLHNAILAGYDEEEQTVMLLDHRWSKPQVIPMQALRDSRSIQNVEVNPRGAFRAMLLPEPPATIHDEIEYALRLNVSRLLHPFAFKMGLPGLKTFRKEIDVIAHAGLDDDRREAVGTFATLMEKLGTGGGNFRRMYGNFLKKISTMDGFSSLQQIGKQYSQCATLWKQLSINMTDWSEHDNAEAAEQSCAILDQLVRMEYECVEKIYGFLHH